MTVRGARARFHRPHRSLSEPASTTPPVTPRIRRSRSARCRLSLDPWIDPVEVSRD